MEEKELLNVAESDVGSTVPETGGRRCLQGLATSAQGNHDYRIPWKSFGQQGVERGLSCVLKKEGKIES